MYGIYVDNKLVLKVSGADCAGAMYAEMVKRKRKTMIVSLETGEILSEFDGENFVE